MNHFRGPTLLRPAHFMAIVLAMLLSSSGRAQLRPNSTIGAGARSRGGPAASCGDSVMAFRRVISEFQSRQQNTAIVVGIRFRGETVFHEATGLANIEERIPADPEMAFSIASITKAFTGVALLKLVESGRIDLDADIQTYVPDFPRHPSKRPITLRLLAHHLGAVRHWGAERNDSLYARHFEDVHDVLALFRRDPWVPNTVPDSAYAYSSYGYNVIAMAIQNVVGLPFQQYLANAVLRPLDLESVRFDRPGLGASRRPTRYSWYDLSDFHELSTVPQRVPDWDYSHNMAGGGLIANVDDLLAFGAAVRAPGLLTASSIARIWNAPNVGGVQSRMSFGWFPKTDPSRISISGSNAGVQAGLSVWAAQDLVVAVLANSWGRGSRSGELMDDGAEGLIGHLASICDIKATRSHK